MALKLPERRSERWQWAILVFLLVTACFESFHFQLFVPADELDFSWSGALAYFSAIVSNQGPTTPSPTVHLVSYLILATTRTFLA